MSQTQWQLSEFHVTRFNPTLPTLTLVSDLFLVCSGKAKWVTSLSAMCDLIIRLELLGSLLLVVILEGFALFLT